MCSVSNTDHPTSDLQLPSRAYFPRQRLAAMTGNPIAAVRKIVEIGPRLVLMWSGHYGTAERVARSAQAWFGNQEPDPEDVELFIQALDLYDAQPFSGILAPAATEWMYGIGKFRKGTSSALGSFVVAGSGSDLFVHAAEQVVGTAMIPGHNPPDIEALKIANDFLAQEIWAGTPIENLFGGAYEVLVRGPLGYERVNDVIHVFASVSPDERRNLTVTPHPHVLRQWYEDDSLWIVSLSTPEMTAEGLGFRTFVAPSILREPEAAFGRPILDIGSRPNYLCMFHRFELGGNAVPTSLIMKGAAIDEMISFTRRGDTIAIEFSTVYLERVSQMANMLSRDLSSERLANCGA